MTYNESSPALRCFSMSFNMDRGERCILIEHEHKLYEVQLKPEILEMKLLELIRRIQFEVIKNG